LANMVSTPPVNVFTVDQHIEHCNKRF
jgi:hypothetical protein